MTIDLQPVSRKNGVLRTIMLLALILSSSALPADDAPPNIVLILADDLGYGDLGCYGQSSIRTPQIDRLATAGTRFTQAYAGGSVCAASRSVLMTGLHNGHTAARDNIPHYHTYLQESDITLADVLATAGYRCGGIGKWSLGDPGTVGRATQQGFETWFGYLNQDHAHYYFTEYLDDDDGILKLAGNSHTHEHYSHDLLTERALEFIDASQNVPFFLYAAFTLPHFSAKSEDATGFAVPSDEPYSNEDWRPTEKKYAAMITRLDRDVGRIVQRIADLDLSRQTLIIFTSDNGPNAKAPQRFDSNGPLRGFKAQMYEGGIRVPFIATWPGRIPAGRTSDAVIAFQDLLPTCAELAGATPPEDIDGISLVSALRGGELKQSREFLYWDYGHCRRRYDQAVRIGDWKGIRLGVDGPVQLYNLADDPAETRDVASEHSDVASRIADVMATAATPSPRYPIGELYRGRPIWQPPEQ